jgi:hypothetical protein
MRREVGPDGAAHGRSAGEEQTAHPAVRVVHREIERSSKGLALRIVVAIRLFLPAVMVVAVAAVGLAVDAGATSAKAVPYCKTGQKSTTAHPCVKPPKCKTGQRSTTTHPCTKTTGPPTSTTATTATTSGTSTTSAGSTTPAGGAGGGTPANGCPAGQQIPQGGMAGDGDEDNLGMPDDGDGCL